MSLKRLPQAERLLSGTLSAYLSATDTQATVNNPPDVNKLPTYIEFEPDSDNAETVRVVGVAGNVITIERGVYNGGTGTEHQANSTYKQKISQLHWDAIVAALESGYITEDPSQTFTQNSTTEFQIESADHTAYYQAGRILRINGNTDVIVQSSVLTGGHTVVTVAGDSLPATITSVELAIQPRDMTALAALSVDTISEKTSGAGVTVDDTLKVDSIAEKTSGAGVTVDQLLIKDGEINLITGGNIQVNSVDPWRTITLSPGFIKPTTTSGCADSAKIEAGTNDIDYDVLDFDKTTQERAYCNFQMPDSYDGGVIQFRFIWTAAAGTAAQTFELEAGGRAFGDDDAIDQANGTFVGVSDALIATGDIHISAWSGDVTLAGTPSGGKMAHLEFRRDVANDNLDADARLIGVQVRFKQATYSD